jgi:alkanesulfonate monooxygenase SsuD/methylene tetrahydromethanopterin reductase-like flavin-dependent oxidoreductase (luciferase family)
VAFPVPDPPPPIVIGGETANGARLAARIGDGWTTFDDAFERDLPLYLETLEAEGRSRADQTVYVGFQGEWLAEADIRETAWYREPRASWERWRAAGADGAIVLARTTSDVDALVEAVDRW